MKDQHEESRASWVIAAGCLLCVFLAVWLLLTAWRGPTKAEIAPGTPPTEWGRRAAPATE